MCQPNFKGLSPKLSRTALGRIGELVRALMVGRCEGRVRKHVAARSELPLGIGYCYPKKERPIAN